MRLEHVRPIEWANTRPGSFASLIGTDDASACAVALLGLPDDTGVQMNHGVPGAALGPQAFRAALMRYGTAAPAGWAWPMVYDAGDVQPAAELNDTHERVAATAAALLDAGLFPIAIGGGHDLTYPFVRAAAERSGSISGIYLDAHLDVREEPGSGMPFRRLVEDFGVARLDVIGVDRFANTAEHIAWFRDHNGRVDEISPQGPWAEGDLFVSIDLDSIDSAYAPGVSARNPCGLAPSVAAAWAEAAGRCERVRCFDIMELSPPNDENGRTARLAVHLFLSFLRGFSERAGV